MLRLLGFSCGDGLRCAEHGNVDDRGEAVLHWSDHLSLVGQESGVRGVAESGQECPRTSTTSLDGTCRTPGGTLARLGVVPCLRPRNAPYATCT